MKKLYKKLMKTSALICLLILGTGNAWGATSWIGYNKKNLSLSPSSETWVPLGSTGINIQGTRYTSRSTTYLMMESGMKIKNVNNYDGIVLLRFQYYYVDRTDWGHPVDLTITTESAVWNPTITVNEKNNEYSSFSNGILLKMEKGKEYTITYSNTQNETCLCLRYVTIYQESELKTFNDTEENTTLQSTITGTGNKLIQINRTLQGDIWNTFCLPFEQYGSLLSLSGQLDCDAVYRLDSFDGNTITFKRTTFIAGGYPYLIKPKHTIDNPLFFCSVTTYKQNTTESNNGLSFVPTFKPTDIFTTGDENSTKFYLNTSGNLVYPTSDEGNNGKIKGFRAYFEWTGGSSGVKDLNFVFDDSETTGIKTVEHDIFGENGRVYSIDGRYMGDSTDNLSRGIYIQNGRKFVVK